MVLVVIHLVLAALAAAFALPIALVARRNPDRKRHGVTVGDVELTGDVFGTS